MELLNIWLIANVVGCAVALMAFARMNARWSGVFSAETFAGASGAVIGLVAVSAVANMFV